MNTLVNRPCPAQRRPSFAAPCAAPSLRRAAALVAALAAVAAGARDESAFGILVLDP